MTLISLKQATELHAAIQTKGPETAIEMIGQALDRAFDEGVDAERFCRHLENIRRLAAQGKIEMSEPIIGGCNVVQDKTE